MCVWDIYIYALNQHTEMTFRMLACLFLSTHVWELGAWRTQRKGSSNCRPHRKCQAKWNTTKPLSWPDAAPQGLSRVIKIHYSPEALAQLKGSFQKLCKFQFADPYNSPLETVHSGREVRWKGTEWPGKSVVSGAWKAKSVREAKGTEAIKKGERFLKF